jgi:hypothetical protein
MDKDSTCRRIPGKFKKFMAQSFRKKLLFFEALLFQFIAGLILKLVPFRNIPRLFALPSHLTSHISRLTSHFSHLTSQEIKQAIIITCGLSPWKNKCLVQSLAARWMLNRRGIHSQLSLGVTLGRDKKMIAHAWLKVRNFEVVEKNGNYLELYLF